MNTINNKMKSYWWKSCFMLLEYSINVCWSLNTEYIQKKCEWYVQNVQNVSSRKQIVIKFARVVLVCLCILKCFGLSWFTLYSRFLMENHQNAFQNIWHQWNPSIRVGFQDILVYIYSNFGNKQIYTTNLLRCEDS